MILNLDIEVFNVLRIQNQKNARDIFNSEVMLHTELNITQCSLKCMELTLLNPDLKDSSCREIPLLKVASTTNEIYSSRLLIFT